MISDTSKVINRIQEQIKESNVSEAVGDLKRLCDSFSGFVQGLMNCQSLNALIWHEYLHDLNHKFLFCTKSIITLIESFYYELKSTGYNDISSVFILNRSLIESYLTYYCQYILPVSNDESLANYCIFKISGLSHRLKYTVFRDISDKLSDEEEIKSLQQSLETNPFFIGLEVSEKYRKELLNGKYAMRYSFPDLIKKSELSDELFIDRWKLYSNYAHSESVGLIQMRYYSADIDSLNSTYYLTVFYPMMLISRYFLDLLTQFKGADCEIGEIDEEALLIIQFWVEMSKSKTPPVNASRLDANQFKRHT